jgi:long-chain acyl-CoA synthetase
MAKIQAGSVISRTVATVLLAASHAYIHAQRLLRGTSLPHLLATPSAADLARAAATAALLAPLHALAARVVYAKIRAALGVQRTVISGGGSLAAHLDDFFEVIGLEVVNGWGMTETSPVIACRRSQVVAGQNGNVRGSVGVAVPGTEIRVVRAADEDADVPPPAYRHDGSGGGGITATTSWEDAGSGEMWVDCAPGEPGVVLVRGPGVMDATHGYLGDPAATAKSFHAGEGWLDTGDLGYFAPTGQAGGDGSRAVLVLCGRAKDTIVLSSGKNVEPAPIEDAVCASPLIKHALLVGQDKRELGLLVFPQALYDNAAAAGNGGAGSVQLLLPSEAEVAAEVARLNAARHDFTPEQHVAHVSVVGRGGGLSPEDGTLTRTMKVRRCAVADAYAQEVQALTARLRG